MQRRSQKAKGAILHDLVTGPHVNDIDHAFLFTQRDNVYSYSAETKTPRHAHLAAVVMKPWPRHRLQGTRPLRLRLPARGVTTSSRTGLDAM